MCFLLKLKKKVPSKEKSISITLKRGIVHPKMKILSSFTHPQVVPNLYECLCSAEHKGRHSEECRKQSSSGAPLTSIVLFFPTMEVNGAPKQPGYKLSSKYLPLCSAEQRHSYSFGTTWGWVNDDRIFIFGWTIPLRSKIVRSTDKDFYEALVSLAVYKIDKTWRGRRNMLHTMHDSELIRRHTLDRAGIMFVTHLIRNMLTSPTYRNGYINYINIFGNWKRMQLCSSDDLGRSQPAISKVITQTITLLCRCSFPIKYVK